MLGLYCCAPIGIIPVSSSSKTRLELCFNWDINNLAS